MVPVALGVALVGARWASHPWDEGGTVGVAPVSIGMSRPWYGASGDWASRSLDERARWALRPTTCYSMLYPAFVTFEQLPLFSSSHSAPWRNWAIIEYITVKVKPRPDTPAEVTVV